MAKITRPDINVQGFASSPQSQERTTFGTETESTNLADFLTPEFLRGWGVLPVGGKPPYQWFNGAVYLISQLQAYQFQAGIPEWSALQEFHENSITKFAGNIYRSKVDDNTGNQPDTSPAEWGALIAPATTTSAGVVEKATTAEAESGAADKFPDAAGVHAAFNQFGIGGYQAVADADLATNSGLYSLPASLGAANSPVSGQSGTLLVIKGGSTSDYVSQVWIQSNDTNTFRQFIRHYRGDSQIWSDWLEMGAPVPESFTLTIGPTGDLPTLNDAIRELSARYPLYSIAGVKVELQLEAGFVMQEQVLARGIDLSWIEITGVDAETVVDRVSLTVDITEGGNIYPVFGAINGGKSPRINQIFSMNRSGDDVLKKGFYCRGSGSDILAEGSGIKNCYGDACFADLGGSIQANNASFDNATGYGAYANRGSSILCNSASAKSCNIGFEAHSMGIMSASSANADNCVGYGFVGRSSGIISCSSASALNAGAFGFYVQSGGYLTALNSTGTVSQAANTVTGNGIIYN